MVKEYLSRHGVSYVEKDVSRDPTAANELIGMGQRGVPVTMIAGQMVVGYDPARLSSLLASQTPPKPALGISIADAAQHAPAGSPPGAYIGRVKPGSPAERAGIQAGDIITQLAGQPVRRADDVFRILEQAGESRQASAQIVRGGDVVRVGLRW
jgi:S1-C subfamily serine protease